MARRRSTLSSNRRTLGPPHLADAARAAGVRDRRLLAAIDTLRGRPAHRAVPVAPVSGRAARTPGPSDDPARLLQAGGVRTVRPGRPADCSQLGRHAAAVTFQRLAAGGAGVLPDDEVHSSVEDVFRTQDLTQRGHGSRNDRRFDIPQRRSRDRCADASGHGPPRRGTTRGQRVAFLARGAVARSDIRGARLGCSRDRVWSDRAGCSPRGSRVDPRGHTAAVDAGGPRCSLCRRGGRPDLLQQLPGGVPLHPGARRQPGRVLRGRRAARKGRGGARAVPAARARRHVRRIGTGHDLARSAAPPRAGCGC